MNEADELARHETLTRLFLELCEVPARERAAALERAAVGHPELRDELVRMLEKHDAAGAFLDAPALGSEFDLDVEAAVRSPDERLAGQRIAGYRLERVLGSGGMGTVYEATQEKPERVVAVKVLRLGASASILRRFEYETQILARLRHPEIAQIYEAGTFEVAHLLGPHDGAHGAESPAASISLPYFVMEYVPGALPLTRSARERDLSLRARLELFARVCRAVHHGHQKGIIHRDLKPANILVDADGQPKVIDFGVARSTDCDMTATTLLTDVGQLVGTLQYMSPEQCAADPHGLDTRSDVYSLGVVLYELLCDRLPYDVSHAALHEALRIVCEEPPQHPSEIRRALHGDLETIALKALEKERERRYASAAELAADIDRYLEDQPIVARPASALYQLRKFARRNRALSGALAASFAVLLVAVIAISHALSREATQRRTAEHERTEADHERRVAEAICEFLRDDLLHAASPRRLGHDVTVREALDAASQVLGGRFADQPLVAAALHETIGTTYWELGGLAAAERHVAAAVELYEAALGPDGEATLAAQVELGGLYEKDSRYDEAEELLTGVLSAARRTLGEQHMTTARALTELGHVASSRGDHERAAGFHAEALAIYRDRLGPDHGDTGLALNNLAMCYRRLRRVDEAEELYGEALSVCRAALGPEDPQTLLVLNNLGSLYFARREYRRAASTFEELIEILERVLPPDHLQTLQAKGNLAANYNNLGRPQEARELLEESLPLLRVALGAGDYYVVVSASNLAQTYRRLGMLDQAAALYDATLADICELLGDRHEFALAALAGLAEVRVDQGRLEEAAGLFAAAAEGFKGVRPEHDPEAMFYRHRRARACLVPLGQLEEAERELLELHALSRSAYGDDYHITIGTRGSLSDLYRAWERPEEAARWGAAPGGAD